MIKFSQCNLFLKAYCKTILHSQKEKYVYQDINNNYLYVKIHQTSNNFWAFISFVFYNVLYFLKVFSRAYYFF